MVIDGAFTSFKQEYFPRIMAVRIFSANFPRIIVVS
jgi:hypothetical protein